MVVGNLASRSPWDFSPHANASTNTTAGNNARSAESWQDGGQPGPNQFHPVSTTRDYTFPWTNEWFTKDCDPGTPYGANFQVGKSFDVSAAAVNLFTVHNRMHDFAYLLGFTEDNFNSQESNFGLTESFRENDPVVGDVQAGAATAPPDVYASSRNNANMSTLPDGSSSITNMYLWQPVAGAFYPPCVDGDFDAGVIGHEYTHMIENRTIGKGSEPHRLPGRRDGRGLGRPVLDRGAQRVRPRAHGRREPLRDRHLRDRQQAARHPQLRARTSPTPAPSRSRASTRRSTR